MSSLILLYFVEEIFAGMCCQVKPLLEVTNNEEKLSQTIQELKTTVDRYDKLSSAHEELEKQKRLLEEARTELAEKLQAEIDICAEAEEVRVTIVYEECW